MRGAQSAQLGSEQGGVNRAAGPCNPLSPADSSGRPFARSTFQII
ncbi:hypothetical protein SOI901_45 [Erwinia phage SOI901]